MAGIRQKGTAPELTVRKAVRALGHRYSAVDTKLPGTPDLVNRDEHWVIFVHGCYWHRHAGCVRASTPRNNRDAWEKKFAENVARDRRKSAALRRLGYSVFTIWECETSYPAKVSKRISRMLAAARQRAADSELKTKVQGAGHRE